MTTDNPEIIEVALIPEAKETIVAPVQSDALEVTDAVALSTEFKTPKGKVKLEYRLRFPTDEEQAARNRAQPYRSREAGADKEQILNTDADKADWNLFLATIQSTRGYKENIKPEMSVAEKRHLVPSSHGTEVVRGVFTAKTTPLFADTEDTELEFFDWEEEAVYELRTTVGKNEQYVLGVKARQPSEKETARYKETATNFLIEKGSRKPITEITVNLAAAIDLFAVIIKEITNLTVKGEKFDSSNPLHVKATM